MVICLIFLNNDFFFRVMNKNLKILYDWRGMLILLILCIFLIGCQQTEDTKDVEAVLNKILKCYGYENMPTERVFFKDNRFFRRLPMFGII